jgi:hypothetical protein
MRKVILAAAIVVLGYGIACAEKPGPAFKKLKLTDKFSC